MAGSDYKAEYERAREHLLNTLLQHVDRLVSSLEKRLLSLPTQVGPDTPSPERPLPTQGRGSLPWFKYGLRGLLRKLLHGNNPENPDWQWHRENVMTLESYTRMSEGIDVTLEEFFIEAGVDDMAAALQNHFQWFRSELAKAIKYYMAQMHQVGRDYGKKVGYEIPREKQQELPFGRPTRSKPKSKFNPAQRTLFGDEEPPTETLPPKPPEPPKPTEPAEPPKPPEPTKPPKPAEPKPTEPPEAKKPEAKKPKAPPNPVQVLLRKRKKSALRGDMSKEELAAALKFLHEKGVVIDSPGDVIDGMEKLANPKYEDSGDLLWMYGSKLGLDPDDPDQLKKILKTLGIDELAPEGPGITKRLVKHTDEEGDDDILGISGNPSDYGGHGHEDESFDDWKVYYKTVMAEGTIKEKKECLSSLVKRGIDLGFVKTKGMTEEEVVQFYKNRLRSSPSLSSS